MVDALEALTLDIVKTEPGARDNTTGPATAGNAALTEHDGDKPKESPDEQTAGTTGATGTTGADGVLRVDMLDEFRENDVSERPNGTEEVDELHESKAMDGIDGDFSMDGADGVDGADANGTNGMNGIREQETTAGVPDDEFGGDVIVDGQRGEDEVDMV
jgi:hypothetical protein